MVLRSLNTAASNEQNVDHDEGNGKEKHKMTRVITSKSDTVATSPTTDRSAEAAPPFSASLRSLSTSRKKSHTTVRLPDEVLQRALDVLDRTKASTPITTTTTATSSHLSPHEDVPFKTTRIEHSEDEQAILARRSPILARLMASRSPSTAKPGLRQGIFSASSSSSSSSLRSRRPYPITLALPPVLNRRTHGDNQEKDEEEISSLQRKSEVKSPNALVVVVDDADDDKNEEKSLKLKQEQQRREQQLEQEEQQRQLQQQQRLRELSELKKQNEDQQNEIAKLKKEIELQQKKTAAAATTMAQQEAEENQKPPSSPKMKKSGCFA